MKLITEAELQQVLETFGTEICNEPSKCPGCKAAAILRTVMEREGPTVSTKFARVKGNLVPLWFVPEINK